MKLKEYFSETKGFGVISTSNDKGQVNSAVYARPHVNGPHSISFIMRDRLTRANLQTNPHAHYLFKEDAPGVHGLRLSLTKTEEVQDNQKIAALSRRSTQNEEEGEDRFLVTFNVDKALVLVGGDERDLE